MSKKLKLQNFFDKEKSIYVLQSTMYYKLCVECYGVFLLCYNSKPFSVILVSVLNYKKCIEVTKNCIQAKLLSFNTGY